MHKIITKLFSIILLPLFLYSCSTIESTFDSTVESINEAGEYFYDSVAFWEEEELEQNQAIIVEEAIEVPEFAIPPDIQQNQQFVQPNQPLLQQPIQPNYGYFQAPPVYRSARQYFSVTPNGTPMPAPPPPPFPQYSIERSDNIPYSYGANYNNLSSNSGSNNYQSQINNIPQQIIRNNSESNFMTEEQEMELFGIQNNCIRVVKDYMSGGYECDDFD